MPSDGLFGSLSGTEAMRSAVGDNAWLQAMLDTEAALAEAEAAAGLFPVEVAELIADACRADRFDAGDLGRRAVASGTPVLPLVEGLRVILPDHAARWVHFGATSQDIVDTAAMLVSRRALAVILGDLAAACDCCAVLADNHRSTVMAGRTLLQQAVPITFGLKAAGWLVALVEVRARLGQVHRERLAVQLGGAAGTLAALGPTGPAVVSSVAARLGLHEPPLPWHTNRVRVAEVATALGTTLGVAGKVAGDVVLLAQTEVDEVAEAGGSGRGRSSTMPHKRNPVGAVAVTACVTRGQALVGALLGSMVQEHERAAGAWQGEWETSSELLALTGAAVERLREVLDGLEVDPTRMRDNMSGSSGLIMAEAVVMALARRVDRVQADTLVAAAGQRAAGSRRSLADELVGDDAVLAHLSPSELEAAVRPAGYLGAADHFIDRALAAWRPEA